MKSRTVLGLLAIAGVLAGCGLLPPEGTTSTRDLITANDIAATNAHTAYEVVRRLQPQWLTSRGSTSLTDDSPTIPTVFLNGVEAGDTEYLKEILAEDVREMRYVPAGEAGARYGMGHQRGVIAVTIK